MLADKAAGRDVTAELSTRGKEATRSDTAGPHSGVTHCSVFFFCMSVWDVMPYRWMNSLTDVSEYRRYYISKLRKLPVQLHRVTSQKT